MQILCLHFHSMLANRAHTFPCEAQSACVVTHTRFHVTGNNASPLKQDFEHTRHHVTLDASLLAILRSKPKHATTSQFIQ